MVRVGLLSDSHGFFDPAWSQWLADCDEIWHAGDFGGIEVAEQLQAWAPLRGVYGNIDAQDVRRVYPEHLRFEVQGIRVWMTHIGGQPKRYPAAIRDELKANTPDLFICGHSHIVRGERDRYGAFHLNPGACGRQGFHLLRTLMLLELEPRRVASLRVVELGPR